MKTQEVADFLSAELVGDGSVVIERVAALSTAAAGEIAFVEKADATIVSGASCLIVPLDFSFEVSQPFVRTKDPKLAFARVAELLHPPKDRPAEVHPSAVISATSRIGTDVFIGAFTCVGDNSTIGDGTHLRAGAKVGDNVTVGSNCVLHPNVFIEDGCTIGDNVVLHAGVVIGADGFGYVRDRDRYVKFPQIGTVVIEDNVEIGANSCIDRGALGETRIGEGTKIDNLVQIAHNVQIGKRVVIAAQTGISGSTVIEDDCVIAGQVGLGDHVTLKSRVVIGARSAVFPGKIIHEGIWMGVPVQPLDEYKRQNAHVKGIARLKEQVKSLDQKVEKLGKGADENEAT